ncbi:DUF4833 domain-containing protein [Pseudoruegeria sp. HB172150]|uniref:DUF4833 domain-containing protein n=1 Tax=Pseudoruegeria sp. HB172150 TaxID=2721164 RepID=UPI001C12DF07|nr:DUF4833 domain-containing protein [Pseudoruegeria sp. HB172150]
MTAIMNRRAMILSSGAAALLPALPAGAATLRSVKVAEQPRVPLLQPEWPVPDEPNQIFYLQRSINANTIVFTARYDGDGQLVFPDAAEIYWRRYGDAGERMPLKPIEKILAFGMQIRKRPEPDQYTVWLNPLPQLSMLLMQTAPGQAQLLGRIGGQTARAVYAYAEVDDTGLIPRVNGLSLHGVLPDGGAISEYFSVAGGEYRP